MKERDEAREALTSLQKTMGFAPTSSGAKQEAQEESADVEMEAQGALPADVEAKIMETNQACVYDVGYRSRIVFLLPERSESQLPVTPKRPM